MAADGARLGSTRRGQVLFLVFTRRRWRSLLWGGLLLTFVLLLAWQNVGDKDSTIGAGTAAGDEGVTVVPVLAGVASPNPGAAGESLMAGTTDAQAIVRVNNPDDLAPADIVTVVLGEIANVQATNIPPPRIHPFDELRLERERTRSRQTEALQQAANDVTSRAEERETARAELQRLWTRTLREAELEHLLQAQGYTAVVVLSDEGAQVVVDALLDVAAATRIGELVGRVAGVRREAISIVDSLSSGG